MAKLAKKSELKNSLDLYVVEWEDGWYNNATCTKVPMGWDAPKGPFKTFDEAFADLMKDLPEIAEGFKSEGI